MKSLRPPSAEFCSRRSMRWPNAKLIRVAGFLGLSCCAELPSVFTTDGPSMNPDMAALPMNPDMAAAPMNLDPTVTIPVLDCAAASLIQAILEANDELAHPGPDVIGLKSGCVYTLTGPNNWWYGPTGLPPITSDITIRPQAGGTGVVIEREPAAPKFRLFYVNGAPTTNVLPGSGSLTLQNLTLRNGLARGGNGAPIVDTVGGGGGGGLGAGGAIFAQGSVTLNGVTLTANTAQGGAGSAGLQLGAGGGMGGDGGTVNSTLIGQGGGGGMKDDGGKGAAGVAGNGGDGPLPGSGGRGGITGKAGMGGITPGGETGGPAGAMAGLGGGSRGLGGQGGGAPSNAGDGGGGGQVGATGAGGGGAGFGGQGGDGTFTSTIYVMNYSGGGGGFGGGGGGGIGNNTSTVGGGGGVGGGGAGQRGGGGFGGGGAGGGGTPGAGGGGAGGFGGGGGRNGFAGFGGGRGSATAMGFDSGGGGGAGLGGAVFLMYGSLTVVNSTLSGNRAQGGDGCLVVSPNGGVGGQGLGGAVFVLNGTATFTQATLANNSVANGSNGPALGSHGSAVYIVSFGKDAPGSANATATLTLANSLLADDVSCGTGADVALVADQRSGSVSIQAMLPNLIEGHTELAGATFAGFPILADPKLDDLKANGGPTYTKTLALTSPAAAAGDLLTCTQAGIDQRGQTRDTTTCHLGAVDLTAITQPSGCACTMSAECSSNACISSSCQ